MRREFPAGVTTGAAPADWRYTSTAGTTDRMTVIADFRKRDHARSSELRALRLASAGTSPSGPWRSRPTPATWSAGWKITDRPASWATSGMPWRGKLFRREARSDLRGRFERQVVMRLHTLPPHRAQCRLTSSATFSTSYLGADRPRPGRLTCAAFPLYLLWLADRCRRPRAERSRAFEWPALSAVWPRPAWRTGSPRGLGCRFADKYGTSELGTVAASCGRGAGHARLRGPVSSSRSLRDGQPAEPGSRTAGRHRPDQHRHAADPLRRRRRGPATRGRARAGATAAWRSWAASRRCSTRPSGLLTPSEVADTFFCDPAVANFRLEEVSAGSFEAAVVAEPPAGTPDLAAGEEQLRRAARGRAPVRVRSCRSSSPNPAASIASSSPRPRREAL